LNHRFFVDHTYTGGTGLKELPPPPWTPDLPAEFRYVYDVLEHALPAVQADALRFYITKEAYFLPEYGRDVVGILLQEERCKTPVYGRHVRAVIRNLHSRPFLGYRPSRIPGSGFSKLDAVLTFEFLRDSVTSLKSRRALAAPPPGFPAPVRAHPVTVPLPLGYHSQVELPQIPMADRPLDTFFAGQVATLPQVGYQRLLSSSKIEARRQIWKVLQALQAEGKWHLDLGTLSAGDGNAQAFGSYSEKMMQSRICIAPRGSMADTFRAFEGLRAGCLVVANALPKDAFMYPRAPLLYVHHWHQIRAILERYARDIDALEAWRAKSLAWWHDHLRPQVLAIYVAHHLNQAGATLFP